MKFDVLYGADQNLEEESGFAKAVWMTLKLKPGGLLYCGLPCCSYSWVSRSVHRRSADNPNGDTTSAWVRAQNVLGFRLGLLILLALARRCHVALEHPKSSCLPHVPWLCSLFSLDAPALLGWSWYQAHFYMGCFGSWSPKGSTCPWTAILRVRGTKMNKALRKAWRTKLASLHMGIIGCCFV